MLKFRFEPRVVCPFAFLFFVATLTCLAFLGNAAPYDQRTGSHLAGASLEMPLWVSIFEPFLSLYYIVVGAADYKRATVSVGSWLFVLAFAALLVTQRKTGSKGWSALGNSFSFATGITLLFYFYLFVLTLLPVTG